MLALFLMLLVPTGYAALCNSAPWTDSERNAIVKVHNDLRSKIALGVYRTNTSTKGPATDMLKMVYDCKLEASAQAWADTCTKSHSGSGENRYGLNTYSNNFTGQGAAASKLWESEFITKIWDDNKYYDKIGHASQMAWSTTQKVGCGVKVCDSNGTSKYLINLFCQYYPPGNMVGGDVFTEGEKCSQCPSGTTCEKCTGLCK